MNRSRDDVRFLMFVLLVFAGVSSRAFAEEADWKVGLASVKITPDKPLVMAGYRSRVKPFEKVTSDLYAKAMSLEDREGHVAVIVTSDLIGLSAAIAEPICARLSERAGLKREQILLNSSHVHTGPALSLRTESSDGSPEDAQRTVEYTKQLQDKLVELVIESLKNRQPAKLSWGGGVANFVLNRRQNTPKGVILGANPRGPADRTVPIMRIDSPTGELRAILFGAATHNTTLRANCYELAGDYAGFAQANLLEKHPGVQAMFMLGLAGDSDPYPHGTMELARTHGRELSDEVDRVLQTKLEPIRGALKLSYGKVDLPLETLNRGELEQRAASTDRNTAAAAKRLLETLDKGEKLPESYSAPVAVWQFGEDMTLVALSGEVVSDYVQLIEKAIGPNRLWLSAYCNDYFGYVPSARLLEEGGYETGGLRGVKFSPLAQEALVGKVRELAEQVRKATPTGRLIRLEEGSFSLNPRTGQIQDGARDYKHPEASAILQAVMVDWMTNPTVKKIPYGYLTDFDKSGKRTEQKLKRLLIEQRSVPDKFQLQIPDVKVELFDRSKQPLAPGEMCIRVDRFAVEKNGEVEIEFVHSGYGIIGGAWNTYRAKKVNDKWTVMLTDSFDP